MPVMDEFREEREAIKNGSLSYKLKYIWDYYKWVILGTIAAILIIISIVKDVINTKDFIFYGLFLNSYSPIETVDAYMDEFAKEYELDTENYDVTLDATLSMTVDNYDEASMATINRIIASMSVGELDFIAADPAVFDHYATQYTFADLSTLLTAEQKEKLEPYFYYMDGAEADRRMNSDDAIAYTPKEYDHQDPSSMEKPILVGLYIQDSPSLSKMFVFKDTKTIYGIPASSKHQETAIQFIDYIFKE